MKSLDERQEWSIRELDPTTRSAVIRVFAEAIGAASTLAEAGVAGEVVSLEAFRELLGLREWPSAEATMIELAYLSRPIPGDEVGELDGYSVFWATRDDGYEVWIGRSAVRPSDRKAYLRNKELLVAVVEAYGFYVSDGHRRDWTRYRLKRRVVRFWLPAAVWLLIPVIMGIVMVAERGWSVGDFELIDASLVGAYLFGSGVTYCLLRWGGSTPFRVGYVLVFFGANIFLAIAFDRTELTQSIGLFMSLVAGLYVTAWKNWDLLWLNGRDVLEGRFVSLYAILATWAGVASATFGAYQALTRAVDGTFLGGDPYLVVPVIVVGVLVLAEYVRSQIAK